MAIDPQLAGLARSLSAAAVAAEPLAQAAIRKVATDIQATAQRLAPVDTGFLRSSIGVTYSGAGASFSAQIAATAEYAGFVEYGTSRTPPQPFLGPAFDQHLPRLEAAMARIARV